MTHSPRAAGAKGGQYYMRPMLLITAVLASAVLAFLCVFLVVHKNTSDRLTQTAITDSTQALRLCAREVGSAFHREWQLVTNNTFISNVRASVSYINGRLDVPMNYSRMLSLQRTLISRYSELDLFSDMAILFLTRDDAFICSLKYISDDFERDYEHGLFRYGDMSYGEFIDELKHSAEARYVNKLTDARYLVNKFAGGYAANTGYFVYRYSDANSEAQVYALLQVNLDNMRDKFESIHYAGDFFMLADSASEVYSSNPDITLALKPDGTYTDGATDTVYLSASADKLGYTCFISLDQATIYAGIESYTSMLKILFYTFVLLSIVLAILFFRRWHYPVIRMASQISGEPENTAIGTIDAHITSLEAQNTTYQKQIDQLSQPARETLFTRLYTSEKLTPDDMELIGRHAGISPIGSLRCVCVGCLSQSETERALTEQILSASDSASARLYAGITLKGVFTALIAQDAYDTADEFYASMNAILKSLNAQGAGVRMYAMGVSDAYIGYESVSAAYREAYTGWIDALTWQNSAVVHSDTFTSVSNQYRVGYDQLESMYQALNSGDITTAASIYDKLVDANFSPKRDYHLRQLFCNQFYYDIIGVLTRLSTYYDILPALESLMSHSRNVSISEQLSLLRSTLCECVDLIPVRDAANDLSMQIQAYCKAQYMNPGASTLSAVADHFKLSESNLSKFFKAHIGINFSNYIENLRLRQAEKLLIEGKLPVRNIALNVGYLNSTTFYYAFKRHHSRTPTQWLEQYKAATQSQISE